MPDADILAALDAVHTAEQTLLAAKLHLVQQVEVRRIPARDHVASCAGWLRGRLRVSGSTARRLVEAARAIDRRPDLDTALSAGILNVDHALVVDDCIAHLPPDAGIEAAAKAETMLIDWAAEFDPHSLRRLGARILDHVAPDVAERADAAALARHAADAHAARTLSLTPDGHGRVRVTGWLDAEAGAIVRAALDPLCAPRSTDTGRTTADRAATPVGTPTIGPIGTSSIGTSTIGTSTIGTSTIGASTIGTAVERALVDERTAGQRRADALTEVCRLVLAGADLPASGGDRPQITVTVAFDPIRRSLSAGTLDSGERLTPAQVRRLACDARLLPAVLGGDGQLLDLGRSRRLVSGPLRRAVALRDGGCAFPGCDRPPRWCDAHHIRAWSDGGETTLDNAVLLCGPHHRLLHHSDWQVRLGHDRRPEFLPPPYIDPHRRPRRNILHDRR